MNFSQIFNKQSSEYSREPQNLKQFFSTYGIYIALLLIILILSILSPTFLKPGNILNVLRQSSINGIISIGMTLIIINGSIDLSVGAIVAVSAVIASSFAHTDSNYPLVVPLIIGIGMGALLGAINGFIISRTKIAPFIVTLGMMTAARGIALVYTSGKPEINLSDSYKSIGGGLILGIPTPVIIFFLISLFGIFLLKYTRFGRQVYATGGNELAAKISGINTKNVVWKVFIIAGALAGLVGIIVSSRVMAGAPSAGTGYELDAIAAVVIGGTSLKGGYGSILGTLTGVLIIAVMNNGLDILGVSSYWQQIVKGAVIVMAAMLDKKK
jgi:ribose/xylose/arabinose/galactoside ABC-type transport system permease subunit